VNVLCGLKWTALLSSLPVAGALTVSLVVAAAGQYAVARSVGDRYNSLRGLAAALGIMLALVGCLLLGVAFLALRFPLVGGALFMALAVLAGIFLRYACHHPEPVVWWIYSVIALSGLGLVGRALFSS
jgi:hypothetical protein